MNKGFNFIKACVKTVETIVPGVGLGAVGIRLLRLADGVKAVNLFCRKFPVHRTEVLPELFFGTGSYDEAAHRGALQQPAQATCATPVPQAAVSAHTSIPQCGGSTTLPSGTANRLIP